MPDLMNIPKVRRINQNGPAFAGSMKKGQAVTGLDNGLVERGRAVPGVLLPS